MSVQIDKKLHYVTDVCTLDPFNAATLNGEHGPGPAQAVSVALESARGIRRRIPLERSYFSYDAVFMIDILVCNMPLAQPITMGVLGGNFSWPATLLAQQLYEQHVPCRHA